MVVRRKPQTSSGRSIKNGTATPGDSDPVLHNLVASEIILLATVLVCTIMIWNNNVNVYGISYFGVTTPTLPIVAIGFVLSSSLLLIASAKLPTVAPFGLVKATIRVVSVGMVLLLLTPYTLDTFFNWSHMVLGATVFATEMYTGAVLCFRHMQDRVSKWALATQLFGGLLAAFSLPDNMLNFMLEGEVIFQIGFMILLNHFLHARPAIAANPIAPDVQG